MELFFLIGNLHTSQLLICDVPYLKILFYIYGYVVLVSHGRTWRCKANAVGFTRNSLEPALKIFLEQTCKQCYKLVGE